MDVAVKRDFNELLETCGVGRSDLIAALEELIADGQVARTSDGFVTTYSLR